MGPVKHLYEAIQERVNSWRGGHYPCAEYPVIGEILESRAMCKNVRSADPNWKSEEPIRVELQKTRNSKDGSNTRAYRTDQFDILSACLFNRIGSWSFLHIAARHLHTRQGEPDFLKIMQEVPRTPEGAWRPSAFEALVDL